MPTTAGPASAGPPLGWTRSRSSPRAPGFRYFRFLGLGQPRGMRTRARRHCDQAMELARSQAPSAAFPTCSLWPSRLTSRPGRWSLVLAQRQPGPGSGAGGRTDPHGIRGTAACSLTVEAAQGRDEDCLRHARQADRLASQLGLPLRQFRAPSDLAAARARPRQAGEGSHPLTKRWGDWRPERGFSDAFTSPIPDLIEAHARAGAVDRARALLPEYLDLVTRRRSAPLVRRRCGAVPGHRCRRRLRRRISWTRSGCTSASRALSSMPVHTCATGNACVGPAAAATPASSSAPPWRSSTGSTPAPGRTARGLSCAPPARP